MSFYVILLGLLFAPDSKADSPIVVHFTAPWCSTCQQMKPGIASLKQDGYDIRIVDVTKNESLVKRYGVKELPTTVILRKGRIEDRRIGYLTEQKLQTFIDSIKASKEKPKVSHSVSTISRTPIVDGPFEKASHSRWMTVNRARIQPLTQMLSPSVGRQLLRATVRIKLKDASGISYGSGTIIHSQPGRALIATCGHLFRDGKDKMTVRVDVFYPGGMKQVKGQVLIYDANEYDVALVTIPFDGGITPVKIAGAGMTAKEQRVISSGSNGGARPSLERTVIKSINRYEGPDNIQIHGAPVGGRSGGGLVNQDGQLIGICNAADHEDNEGFYVSSRYITLMMQRLGIDDLIRNQ